MAWQPGDLVQPAGSASYPVGMAKLAKPRRSPPRNNRILSLLVKQIKRRPPSPNTILTESGDQLQAESGHFLRTEQ